MVVYVEVKVVEYCWSAGPSIRVGGTEAPLEVRGDKMIHLQGLGNYLVAYEVVVAIQVLAEKDKQVFELVAMLVGAVHNVHTARNLRMDIDFRAR
jgi:uncharacterized membrane protein